VCIFFCFKNQAIAEKRRALESVLYLYLLELHQADDDAAELKQKDHQHKNEVGHQKTFIFCQCTPAPEEPVIHAR